MTALRQKRDDGYGIVPVCLSEADCERIAEQLGNSDFIRTRAGARHLMKHPAVAALAGRRELMEIADEWLGGCSIPFRATLFDKFGDSNWLIPWHQDTALPLEKHFDSPGWTAWSEKAGVAYAHAPEWALCKVIALRVHLDDSTTDNGPLRVIPRSHAQGVLNDKETAKLAAAGNAVECCVPRGGVIVMRPLTVHCSSKARNSEPRRVMHIEYTVSLELAEGIRLQSSR